MKWILIFLDSFTIAQVVEFDKTHCIVIQFFLDSFTIAQVVEFGKTHCIVIQLSLHKCNLIGSFPGLLHFQFGPENELGYNIFSDCKFIVGYEALQVVRDLKWWKS